VRCVISPELCPGFLFSQIDFKRFHGDVLAAGRLPLHCKCGLIPFPRSALIFPVHETAFGEIQVFLNAAQDVVVDHAFIAQANDGPALDDQGFLQ
jgi:hypothetical protein